MQTPQNDASTLETFEKLYMVTNEIEAPTQKTHSYCRPCAKCGSWIYPGFLCLRAGEEESPHPQFTVAKAGATAKSEQFSFRLHLLLHFPFFLRIYPRFSCASTTFSLPRSLSRNERGGEIRERTKKNKPNINSNLMPDCTSLTRLRTSRKEKGKAGKGKSELENSTAEREEEEKEEG